MIETIPPGKEGQILMRQRDGSWQWIDVDTRLEYERSMRWYVIIVSATVITMLLGALALCFFSVGTR